MSTTIRCICGDEDQEDERTFVQCSTCEVWQHNVCMGFPEANRDLPKDFFCEKCEPDDHPRLKDWVWNDRAVKELVDIRNKVADGECDMEEEEAELVAECMALVQRIDTIEDYWAIYLPANKERKWPPGSEAESHEVLDVREGICRSIEILLSHAQLTVVENFRAKMIKNLRTGPVTVVGFLWKLKRLLTPQMLKEVEDTNDETEEGNVLFYFGWTQERKTAAIRRLTQMTNRPQRTRDKASQR